GYREQHSNNGAAVNNYLFHDIGLATFDLPLFGSDILSSRSLLQNFTSIFDYNNLVGNYGH
ncbi:MAG: hypothetical protein Q7S14_02550, partial [bacterium]|nr:hypothetical protein [bacterium]